MFSNHPPLF